MAGAVLALLALTAARLEWTDGETIAGHARVVDGDSLEFAGRRVRLIGIDAPEYDQMCQRGGRDYACGVDAVKHLRAMTRGHEIICMSRGVDRYGRDLARCRAGGADLNRAMVRAGLAVSYGDYHSEERAAQNDGTGLWAGTFERPGDWRAIHGGLYEPLHNGLSAVRAFLRRLFGV